MKKDTKNDSKKDVGTGKIITIANQKGGTGKTVTAAALIGGLRLRGLTVLAVDLDAQGNLTYLYQGGGERTVLDVLIGKVTAMEAVQNTDSGDIIASSPDLAAIDFLLTGERREYRLREALYPLRKKYDFIVIDTPPALGTLSVNALAASDGVVVTALADVFSMQGIFHLGETIQDVRRVANPELMHWGILLTRHNERSVINRDMGDLIRSMGEEQGVKIFRATIHEAVAVREAAAMRKDVFAYSKRSRPAKDYEEFIDELLEIMRNK